jgi:predicted RecB family nuclease
VVVNEWTKGKQHHIVNEHSVWVVASPELAWRVFFESVQADQRPIYHWTSFDSNYMQRETADAELLGRLSDLYHWFDKHVKFPIPNQSLKTVGRYLGMQWLAYDRYDLALIDFNRWVNQPDEWEALARSCKYQQDDVIALHRVLEWLNANA